MERWKYDHEAGGVTKLPIEYLRVPDLNRVHFWCMSAMTGS